MDGEDILQGLVLAATTMIFVGVVLALLASPLIIIAVTIRMIFG